MPAPTLTSALAPKGRQCSKVAQRAVGHTDRQL